MAVAGERAVSTTRHCVARAQRRTFKLMEWEKRSRGSQLWLTIVDSPQLAFNGGDMSGDILVFRAW